MPTFNTSAGHSVPHCHVRSHPISPCSASEWTSAQKQLKRALMAAAFPNAVEVLLPSRKYNCHGYVYTGAHGWFGFPDLFIADDFFQVSMASAQVDDVLVYEDDVEITHSAFVDQVTGGVIRKVRSKWGKMAAFIHDPTDVPGEYGRPVRLIRRNVPN